MKSSEIFDWLENTTNPTHKLITEILIETIFNKRKKLAGYRTIRMDLENKYGVIMNTKKIRRLMNKYGIKTQVRKKNPYKEIMKKTQEHSTCENVLNREFKQTKPLKTFCTDITYLYYGKCEKAYLSAVKDIATGEIVAYKVAKHLTIDNDSYRAKDVFRHELRKNDNLNKDFILDFAKKSIEIIDYRAEKMISRLKEIMEKDSNE